MTSEVDQYWLNEFMGLIVEAYQRGDERSIEIFHRIMIMASGKSNAQVTSMILAELKTAGLV